MALLSEMMVGPGQRGHMQVPLPGQQPLQPQVQPMVQQAPNQQDPWSLIRQIMGTAPPVQASQPQQIQAPSVPQVQPQSPIPQQGPTPQPGIPQQAPQSPQMQPQAPLSPQSGMFNPQQQQPQGQMTGAFNLPALMNQLGQQAQPQPLQPQGYRNAAANAQLGLLGELSPGGGQFEKYRQDEVSRFQNQLLPQLSGQMRGRGLGAFSQAAAGGAQDLAERLGTQRLGYEQQRQGQLGQLLGQGQQLQLQQQQAGLQGLQGIGGLQQRMAEGPLAMQLQALQALLGAGRSQAAAGLGQGGDTAIDQGAMAPLVQGLMQALQAYAGGRAGGL